MYLGSNEIKSLFHLDRNVTYLNHGSFGACPKELLNTQFNFQKELEKEPVKHLAFDIVKNLEKSRIALSHYVNCDKDDVVYFPNPSTALNTVLRSLKLEKEDEVLSTNHEYGAMDKAWNYLSKKIGFKYINQKISVPLTTKDFFIKEFFKGITKKTRVIFLSHITSPTGLIFPIKEICKIAREKKIITIIDGAHVPGHIKLDLKKLNADFYSGACHKWMCSPKGVAFLYSNKNLQHLIEPLVISWGYDSENASSSQLLDYLQWQGTNDISAYLTIPETINFLKKNNWNEKAKKCRELNLWAVNKMQQELSLKPLANSHFIGQMSSYLFDFKGDLLSNQLEFYKKYKIQIPFFSWNDNTLFRISVQAYNNKEEIEYFIHCFKDHFKANI
ncbi:MAG: aminotransferase [Flavobacteriales bacterium]|nr:aminotransferase [Flavobacteriales bacterium]